MLGLSFWLEACPPVASVKGAGPASTDGLLGALKLPVPFRYVYSFLAGAQLPLHGSSKLGPELEARAFNKTHVFL